MINQKEYNDKAHYIRQLNNLQARLDINAKVIQGMFFTLLKISNE
jgi:hypothetical protein